jgi:Osmosensitive K+ channel histidine kinase
MGNRIRIIWALSLASAILLIGVQGYWLYNQYKHIVNTYAQELSEKILNAGEKELKKRNNEKSLTPIFESNHALDNLFADSLPKKMVMYGINASQDEIKEIQLFDARLSDAKIEMQMSNFSVKIVHPDSAKRDSETPDNYRRKRQGEDFEQDSDNFTIYFSVDPKIPRDYINKGINQAMINERFPFSEELLDSILVADIPEIEYTMTPMGKQDSIVLSSWYHSGSLFSPYIKVLYIYSIFENKGVEINAVIPSPPLFKSMTIQLLLSLVLILLLVSCLILQIKTILKQKKINELREDFVNIMIHELKRPVQTLKTFISFLGNKDMRSDELITEQVIQDSKFELDNLSAYIKMLKDMISADNDAASLQISRFNLQELIEKVVRLVNNPPEKDVNISVNYEMESVFIEADTVHVANVVNNLIENAIKYSSQQINIEIKAVLKERELRLTVSDNGIGIPYSEQEKVFAKFYRGSNFPDKNIPGIGLGLSYVKLITEAHKGKISLLSDIGKGTSVTICLPQREPPALKGD